MAGGEVHPSLVLRGRSRGQTFRRRFTDAHFVLPIWLDWLDFRAPVDSTQDGVTIDTDAAHGAQVIDLGKGITLELAVQASESNEGYGNRTRSFSWHGRGTISASSGRSPGQLQAECARVLHFFALVVGQPCDVAELELELWDNPDELLVDSFFTAIEAGPIQEYESGPWLRDDALLPFWAPGVDLSQILPGWMKLARADPGVDILAAHKRHLAAASPDYVAMVLDFTRALESLHRAKRRRYDMTRQQTKPVLEKQKEQVPERVWQLMNGNMSGGLDVSFRKRLREVMDEMGPLEYLVGKVTAFINGLYETRNYHTHYDPRQRSKALRGRELGLAAERLRIITEGFLLVLAGAPKELVLFGMATASRTRGIAHDQ